jgi:hypothetical protein
LVFVSALRETKNKNPPREAAGWKRRETASGLLLPGTLLVPVRLQALAALVLVHLQPAFLFQITHVKG